MSETVSRAAIRLAIVFMLDRAMSIRRAIGQDLPRAVVFLAIGWENVREGTLAVPEATAASSHDQLARRIPVSVYKVSRRLRIPYETTRRAAVRLEAAGLCRRTDSGFFVPPMTPSSAVAETQTHEAWLATETFLHGLADAGVPLPVTGGQPTPDLQLRVGRLAVAYFLANLDALVVSLGIDMLTAFIFLAINRANFDPVYNRVTRYGSVGGPDLVLDDAVREPISVYGVSKGFGIPYETTRRHVETLVLMGLCERAEGGGLIVPARAIEAPPLGLAAKRAGNALAEFLHHLAQAGMQMPQRREHLLSVAS